MRVASLAMVGAGALLLMADSVECPDGYAEARFDASFTSTCPIELAPAKGEVHILLPAGNNQQDDALRTGLRAAGFGADSVSTRSSGANSDVCTAKSFTFTRESGTPRLRCSDVTLGSSEQTVTCDGRGQTPLVLRLGRRDLSDGSTPDAAPNDAGDAGDAEGGASTSDGGLAPAPAPSGTAFDPSGDSAIACTITFKQLPR
jgi:hypothetical protein